MGDFKCRIALVALAGAFVLSGCSAAVGQDSEQAQDSASTQESTAPAEASGPEPVAYNKNRPEGYVPTPENEQSFIASSFFWALVSNPYGLSGQWSSDGNDPAQIAQLWDNYFSDGLKDKLQAAEPGADLTGVASWALLAVAPPESSDPIKASPSCKPDMKECGFLSAKDGGMATVNNPTYDPSGAVAGPNQFLGTYNLTLPVSLTDHGNAEGYMTAVLKLNLSFVENPTPGDGRAPYLIDSVNNELNDAQADLLSNRPDLEFQEK